MSALVRFCREALMTIVCGVALAATISPATAQVVSNERDVPPLRLGQKVQVDDGSCPAGQIKEVMGSALTDAGVTRISKCIPRLQRR